MKLKIKLAMLHHHREQDIFLRYYHVYFVTLESLLWIRFFITLQI